MHAFCRDSYPFVEMRFKINDYIPESLGKNKGVLPSRPLSNGAAVGNGTFAAWNGLWLARFPSPCGRRACKIEGALCTPSWCKGLWA